jgi:hypothetical protein
MISDFPEEWNLRFHIDTIFSFKKYTFEENIMNAS